MGRNRPDKSDLRSIWDNSKDTIKFIFWIVGYLFFIGLFATGQLDIWTTIIMICLMSEAGRRFVLGAKLSQPKR